MNRAMRRRLRRTQPRTAMVPTDALTPLPYAREGLPEQPEPAVYLYLIKCLSCGLHMGVWTWYGDWHDPRPQGPLDVRHRLNPTALTCMECGATPTTGMFLVQRHRLPDADIREVPGLVGRPGEPGPAFCIGVQP